MDRSGVEVVSWDVDGTLYAAGAARVAIGRTLLAGLVRLGPLVTLREHERLRRFRAAMRRVRRRGGRLAPGDVPADRAALLALEERWYGPAFARIGLRAGVRDAVETLARRGLRQVVVSDYCAAYKLRLLGLDGAFERLYAGEEIGCLKPSPELFRHVARDLGVEPRRILHVGDLADRDGAAAEGAGCRAVIVGRDLAPLFRALGTG